MPEIITVGHNLAKNMVQVHWVGCTGRLHHQSPYLTVATCPMWPAENGIEHCFHGSGLFGSTVTCQKVYKND